MSEVLLSLLAVCGLLVLSQLSPGPDVFFVFRTALARGFVAGVLVGAGISLGFLIQAGVACSVGAWVMHRPWCVYMLYAAAVWLLYLAWRIFPKRGRGAAEFELQQNAEPESYAALLRQGFLCNILNPKCMLFILTLSAGALQTHAAVWWYAPLHALALSLSGFFGWVLWSALLQWGPVQGFYRRNALYADAVFAVLLAVFAVLLVVQS